MPFVDAQHRLNPDPMIPGDRCYVWYRWMMNEWKYERRWTTADRIYQRVRTPEHDREVASVEQFQQQCAKELAWQVFFVLQVMPYEEEKMEENGDIE
jgi:hypothetical protein